MKTNVFNDCKDLTEVFCEYYRNAIKFDPNLPDGNVEQLNVLKKDLMDHIAEVDFSEKPKAKEELEAFPELLSELIRMEGVEMELIGSWIWLTGQTYLYKDILKDLKDMIAAVYYPKRIHLSKEQKNSEWNLIDSQTGKNILT